MPLRMGLEFYAVVVYETNSDSSDVNIEIQCVMLARLLTKACTVH